MTPFFNPTYIIAVLIAISVHEWAHAYVASRFGDPTPGNNGRLTLNPIAHLDLLGAIMFLVVGFGWAKPVPVNSSYFRRPRRDLALVALAGPFSNFILAFLTFIALFFLSGSVTIDSLLTTATTSSAALTVLIQILRSLLFVNLALMAFNLFPIAPLDGSNVLRQFIPYKYEDQFDRIMQMGPFILVGLILLDSYLPFPVLSAWVFGIMQAVLSFFDVITSIL